MGCTSPSNASAVDLIAIASVFQSAVTPTTGVGNTPSELMKRVSCVHKTNVQWEAVETDKIKTSQVTHRDGSMIIYCGVRHKMKENGFDMRYETLLSTFITR
jgi:hypothetical protein